MNECRLLMLLVLTAALGPLHAGCLSDSDDEDAIPNYRNVEGSWLGETSQEDVVALVLEQTTILVQGTARIGRLNGQLTGGIDGDRFEATIQSDPIRRIFASVNGDFMSGTIRDAGGGILSSFEAIRQL